MSPETRHVAIESLPDEERAKVEALETATDQVYGLRVQLVDFYKKYRAYLPDVTHGGKKRRMDLAELSRAIREGGTLDALVPWDRVDVDAKPEKGEDPAFATAMHRDDVRANIDVALEAYNTLATLGGVWKGGTPAEAKDTEAYYRMRWKELGGAMRAREESAAAIRRVEEKIMYRRNKIQEEGATPAHLKLLDAYELEFANLSDHAHQIAGESPEAYFFIHGRQLKETRDLFDAHGRIVETPYVRAKLAHIQSLLDGGRPVFIHGELGTGKTELAKHLARKQLSKAHCARWEKDHPAPTDAAARTQWEALRAEEAEALVVSGHRGIEIEQILAARAIQRKETPPAQEQVERIAADWKRLEETLQAQGKDVREIERMRGLHERAYLEIFQSPVETKAVFGPVLRAMKEGRPVIIDEMNAIPHHVLIVMNDILMRRPGEMVTPPFPDEPPFRVEEGFCVIATGNYKPEDSVLYPHRQQIDAAFISRFGIVSYDYLPAQREREASGKTSEEQREFREQNELYHMLLTRLLQPDLSVTLPEGSFEKIKDLARVAREIQDIFSGRDAREGFYEVQIGASKIKAKDTLKENVLSIRHLLPILDRWRGDGFRRPLGEYLFLDYVSRSDARPTEKQYLYSVLQTQGDFFPTAHGWPDADAVLTYPIDEKMYAVDRVTGVRKVLPDRTVKLHTYSPKEVIEELFGPAPARSQVRTEFVERGQADVAPEEESEDIAELERMLESIRANADAVVKEDFALTG